MICGFTDRASAHGEVGSLLLGYHEGGELKYAGNVGTGWNAQDRARPACAAASKLEVAEPLFDAESLKPGRWSRRTAGGERWVEPALVAEVSFAEWTPDGHVRQAVFQGAAPRQAGGFGDARGGARACGRADPPGAPPAAATTGSIKVTNPERVIDPSTGLTKLALVRYYESIAERMLPHLVDRPVSLVRAPEGITGELFFQKHPETRMPGLRELDTALWPGHSALLAVDTPDALVSAAQMNTIEFHTWNSTAQAHRPARPHRLRPRPGRRRGVGAGAGGGAAGARPAGELGLESWLKTSGGKGLHVVVPIAPKLGYDAVKGFSQAIVQHLAKHDSAALRRQERRQQPGRQDLRRLPAQRPRRRPRRRRSRPAPGPAWASRCRWPGSSSAGSRAARNGPSPRRANT